MNDPKPVDNKRKFSLEVEHLSHPDIRKCESVKTKVSKCASFLFNQIAQKAPELQEKFNSHSREVKLDKVVSLYIVFEFSFQRQLQNSHQL